MSKEMETVVAMTFADYIADKTQPTLKAIADIFEVPAQILRRYFRYRACPQPIFVQTVRKRGLSQAGEHAGDRRL